MSALSFWLKGCLALDLSRRAVSYLHRHRTLHAFLMTPMQTGDASSQDPDSERAIAWLHRLRRCR